MRILSEFFGVNRDVKLIFEKMFRTDSVVTLGITTPPAPHATGDPAPGEPAPGYPAPRLEQAQVRDIWPVEPEKPKTKTTQYVGWTVSLPDKFMVPITATQKGRMCKVKVRWTTLLPEEQINYFKYEYLPKVVCPFVEKVMCIFEMNKHGNIHAHCVCMGIYNDYQLCGLRKLVAREQICINIVGMNQKKHLHLNYIHWIEQLEDWLQYMQKDILKHMYPLLVYQS